MIPLSGKYEGSVCEIKSEQNDLLVAGMISSIDELGMDVLDSTGEKMLIIPYGKPVKISVFNTKLGFRMLVGTVYTSTEWFLRIIEVETMQDFERRTFFRVNIKLRAYLYLPDEPKESATPEEQVSAVKRLEVRMREAARLKSGERPAAESAEGELPPAPPLPIELENISLSGLLFSTTRKFEMGDAFIIEFQLFKDILKLKCRICRLDSPEDNRNRYGCRFYDYSQQQADKLCGCLFQLQRIEIKKRRTSNV